MATASKLKARPRTKLYEGMFLFDANLASRDWTGLERHVADIFKKHSVELLYTERWPDGKLAYQIKGCKKGTYYLTYFSAPPGAIKDIERDCQLSERILRVLILHHEYVDKQLEARRQAAALAAEARKAAREESGPEDEESGPAGEREYDVRGGTDAEDREDLDPEDVEEEEPRNRPVAERAGEASPGMHE